MNQGTSIRKLAAVLIGVTALGVGLFVACTQEDAKAKPNYVFKASPKEGVAAKVAGEEITEEQLIGSSKLEYMDLQKKIYQLKMDRLKELLVEKLVGAEAKKANLSTEEYLKKNVTKGEIKVSQKEYDGFVKERHIREEQITANPQLKERINSYLAEEKKDKMVQEYVAKLTKSNPVEVYFTKPKMAIQVELGDAPVWGSKDAPVTIFEFSDFQCPFCSKVVPTLDEIKKKYKGKVKIAFKHFPLPMHKEAEPAAQASMCVHEQNADKFWKYHDTLFANQEKLDAASLEEHAKKVGVDVAKFKACMEAKKFEGFVKSDSQYGEKIGVRSTPTFVINGELVSGALPIDMFSEVIDEALAEKKGG